jgi:HD-GYP domain-containing protein (c-di-GMP phosphodiesterase class II)
MERERKGRRYPLHVTITVAFTALLLLLGAGLIAFSYRESRKIALLGAEEQIEKVGGHLEQSIAALYGPVQNFVDVTSQAFPREIESDEQERRALRFFGEVLRLGTRLSAAFVGFENGDLYLVRRAGDPHVADRVETVPEGAAFVVQRIERRAGEEVLQELLLYDDELRLLARERVEWTGFDPRERDWYRGALGDEGQFVSGFYSFYTTRQIGVTFARRLAEGHGVVGADLTLSDLSDGLADHRVTPSSRVALLEPGGGVIALSEPASRLAGEMEREGDEVEMPTIGELDDPVYQALADRFDDAGVPARFEMEAGGRHWLVSLMSLPVRSSEDIVLASLVPRDELLEGVDRVRDRSILISLALLALALVLVVTLSRHLSKSLRLLAREAEHMRELRLDEPVSVRSSIEEVDDLAGTMDLMRSSIHQFLAISHALSAEKDFRRLLEMILDEARRVTGAEGGAILLRSEDDARLEVAALRSLGEQGEAEPALADLAVPLAPGKEGEGPRSVDRETVHEDRVVRLDDLAGPHGYGLTPIRARFVRGETPLHTLLSVPLRTRQGEVIGLLQLVNASSPRGEALPFRDETLPYMEALSSDAAVALDNRRLLRAHKELLESFIHVIAGAIDAKSPYTHGHCQRVPELARLLAEAAHEEQEGPFAGFRLSEDEWYELHLASWLHDCGKVTTPEYVVDKATKLETLYDRIHEIRTRFEVLLRDAEIEYLEARLARGGEGEDELRRELEEKREALREDFAFVAECNLGGKLMSEERVERVRRIASRTWTRHLDDRLGISLGELRRREGEPSPELPVTEPLLADRPEHVVPRPDGGASFLEDRHGFRMEVPENLYDLGEVHNLCIPRGTLTPEERFKINEHIIQTLRMLDRLPFPRELRRVPDWAANHHEKLDGTGYPRRLGADDLSIPERIMAIADIFEALTAVDRPYMAPKKLSQALSIMGRMRDEGHICPELFELMLRSGVHRRYADEHLRPDQVDEIDLEAVLSRTSHGLP